ncbi:M66 family metalloprotease [Providencia rettgeri]|uniref:M66 family metalloprotease n=1 Tax=Providencia rettgeri TaxID=587 RepID=UPI003850D723
MKKNITYFNNSKYDSDTYGDLKGTVYYVQNSIIPAKNHVSNDIQPTLISNRKTMFMFKPHDDLLSESPIRIAIYNENSDILFNQEMLSPEHLTKTCSNVYAEIEADFSQPSYFDFTLDNSEQLQNAKDPLYFNKFIDEYNTINVVTYDGGYSPSFELFYNLDYAGKKVLFQCTSTWGISILFNSTKKNLEQGDSLLLVNERGTWYESTDSNSDGKFLSEIQYIGNTWSVVVPQDVIQPGIKLKFIRDNKFGFIDKPIVRAPNQLFLNTIAIGMLTPHREKFEFQENPEYHRQYFQQIPVSRLIVNTYDPIDLDEVMLSDGRLLTGHAPGNGGWHDGIMREQIAKSLIASGINYANYGINVTGRELGPRGNTSQFTVHTSIGMYENGIQVHGGSGGSGMVTLDDTIGNEFSHEVGHNFGLGHYPGDFDGSVAQIPTHRNSTWGWDCDNNFFLPNFKQDITNKPTYLEDEGIGPCAPPFEGHSLGRDAMAGGSPMYEKHNVFTLHTPYSLFYIQNDLESKAIFDPNSKTGFSIWNNQENKMVEYENKINKYDFKWVTIKNSVDITADYINDYFEENKYIYIDIYDGNWAGNVYFPDANDDNNGNVIKINSRSSYGVYLHMNGTILSAEKNIELYYVSNGVIWVIEDEPYIDLVPLEQGRKVITIIGFYDPRNELPSYIYPPLNSAYGMIYESDKVMDNNNCYLEVEYTDGLLSFHKLKNIRVRDDEMNQFHINVSRDLSPKLARIIVRGGVVAEKSINLGSDNLAYTINEH